MLLVPSPEPCGTAASSEISIPPPNASICARSDPHPPSAWNSGRNPASASAAFASANSLPGRAYSASCS